MAKDAVSQFEGDVTKVQDLFRGLSDKEIEHFAQTLRNGTGMLEKTAREMGGTAGVKMLQDPRRQSILHTALRREEGRRLKASKDQSQKPTNEKKDQLRQSTLHRRAPRFSRGGSFSFNREPSEDDV